MLSAKFLVALLAAPGAFGATNWIVPGAAWYDTAGKKIDAHGGGIVKRGNTFYWLGQSVSNNIAPQMYSSTDLLNWENLGVQASITQLWRPKYAKPNGEYWIFGQQDRYADSLVSSSLVGGYTQHAKVYLPPSSYSYSDTGMFYDDSTETWYLLTSADHNVVQVNAINSDGSVGTRASHSQSSAGAYEAPGMFKAGGVYFLIVSGKTGWRANPNKVFTASSINGPWSGGSDIAPENENTYNSQNTFELTVSGSQATTYIYMGDEWDSSGGASSNYTWLPMSVNTGAKTVTLQYYSMWKVDPNTGVVSTPSSSAKYPASVASVSGRAAISTRSIVSLSPGDEITFSNVTATGGTQWVKLLYDVRNREDGEVHLFVNNEPKATNIAALNSRAGYALEVPVALKLNEGSENTVTLSATGREGFAVQVKGIEVVEN
ncbi:carbohydrate-binding module family 35 protein [Viridothelium virens]|uniref:Carbohydrate-binding module family 35 protein n=1 Tax=Viridothelium virens TaxID=1048519 RepID=A0A6A6GS90_VIRVR|nr:carbohydrate-binding module family 35 protein [Viridothelium virens]